MLHGILHYVYIMMTHLYYCIGRHQSLSCTVLSSNYHSYQNPIKFIGITLIAIIIISVTIIIIVYRGVNESRMKLPEAFFKHDGHNFAGGVELAFMSTSYDINVAIEYGMRGIIIIVNLKSILTSIMIAGTTKESTIFEIEFDGGNRGAKVKWVTLTPSILLTL